MRKEILVRSVIAVLVIAGIARFSYKYGSGDGQTSARESLDQDYDLWAIGLMHEDPQVQLRSITLVKDGARIKIPQCEKPSRPYMRLSRRPDGNATPAEIVAPKDADFWVAKISPGEWRTEPVAAALVGCFTDQQGSLPASPAI